MTKRETATAIEADASIWVARLDAQPGDPVLEARLEQWLAGDERRRGAYLRAEAAWHELGRVRILGPAQPDTVVDPAAEAEVADPTPWHLPSSARRAMIGGLAASLLAVFYMRGSGGPAPLVYTTELGETRSVPLKDGSIVTMNTDSLVEVTLRETERDIGLGAGESWFQVAKDKSRPFVVTAGGARVRAVGTAFSVRRWQNGAQVLVTEGVVEGDAGGRVSRIEAGEAAFIDTVTGKIEVRKSSLAELERALAWRTGQIILQGETLADAVAEFNRYNRRKIWVADPSLLAARLVGRFKTNDPESFARAAAEMLDAEMRAGNEAIRLEPLKKVVPA